ncbi:GATA transcription factor 26-like [Zingiber officinale]|uniref:GATA transcription factor 26-like n=1 Tax=Zingiber officinale TaxID=94328 RepID=UPI001C4D8AAC|nr:GATA transcription factor 26-like [Zingiber officinale]
MGKRGPCCHCGVTSTPLWRNGPPEKPVLCNACGSRWRTKGSLTNYIPLHAREVIDSDGLNGSIKRSITFKLKEQKFPKTTQHKRKLPNECDMQYCDQNFCKFEGDTSNRSSSGSAISGSDSCLYFATDDASNLTGSVQSNICDSLAPSKKTFVTRPKLSVEKLTKELYSIWHEQQASNLSRTSEDDLLYSSITPLGSFEIGYGSVLIKNTNSKTIDDESEASSFPVDKSFFTNEAYSDSAFLPIDTKNKGIVTPGADTVKSTLQMVHANAKRAKVMYNKFVSLKDRDSPLIYTDLNFFINSEGFMKYLTHEEQKQLMKYLPSTDIAKTPESLNSMFTSPQFLATLSCFQQLLQEGILDLSFAGATAEECKILRRLLLQNSTNRWLESYQKIKDAVLKKINGGNDTSATKRKHDKQNQNHSDLKRTMRSPKRVCRPGGMNPPSKCSTMFGSSIINQITDESENFADNDVACFSPKTLDSGLSDKSNTMQSFMQFISDSSEGDLIPDLPTSTSFPEAELYHPWKKKPNPNGSLAASVVDIPDKPTSSFSNKV